MTALPIRGSAGTSPIALTGDCDDDEITRCGRLFGGAGLGSWTKFGRQLGKCLRASRVADHHVVSGSDCGAGDLTADVAGADQADGLNAVYGHAVATRTRR